jgi:hypothetical protein
MTGRTRRSSKSTKRSRRGGKRVKSRPRTGTTRRPNNRMNKTIGHRNRS